MKIIMLILIFLVSFGLHAQSDYFFNPIGAYEGISGNTGIARSGSVGAVIYNPAGLASIKTTKISASASAFSQNEYKFSSDEVNTRTKQIQAIPTQVSTVFHRDKFNWAFSILVPQSEQMEIKAKFLALGTVPIDINSSQSNIDMLIGPSVGFALSKDFHFGVSLFASKFEHKENTSRFWEYGSTKFLSTKKDEFSAITIYPILGLLYKPSKKFYVGMRFSGPSKYVSGSFDSQYNLVENDGVTTNVENVNKKEDAYYEIPNEIGIGISMRLMTRTRFLMDVSNQFKKKFKVWKEDAQGEPQSFSLKNVQRYNMAIEYLTSKTDGLTLGFNYRPSPEEGSDHNFTGVTLGYLSRNDIVDSSYGLFYNHASSIDENKMKTEQTIMGFFLSTTVNFLK